MSNQYLNEIFDLLVRVLPVMHKKIHRAIFKSTIEESGEDIAPHHLMILKMLRESGPITIGEIGELIAVSQSQMTHSTDKLIKLGMVKRHISTDDRRKIRIRLTDKGTEYLEKLEPVMRSRMESKLTALTDEDMDRLATSLKQIADIFAKLHWNQ
jgi:DNA-binding MarR family transcriptional regulator